MHFQLYKCFWKILSKHESNVGFGKFMPGHLENVIVIKDP
jgi:hypothetical protein